jgi:predicted amino acid-binding ACT domain protein
MESKRLPKALLAELEEIADVTCDDKQAIVCLVGEDIHGKPGIAASVFNTIAAAEVNIRMISQGASELNISFVIQESDVPKAVQRLHAQFFPTSAKTTSARKNNGSSKRARANGRGSVPPRARAASASAVVESSADLIS